MPLDQKRQLSVAHNPHVISANTFFFSILTVKDS